MMFITDLVLALVCGTLGGLTHYAVGLRLPQSAAVGAAIAVAILVGLWLNVVLR